jgi:hypothetical protein
MADRYDPKLLVPPLSEGKPAPPAAASHDPVADFARIASGPMTFDPSPAPKPEIMPVNSASASDDDLADDLVSELLKDLQALVSSRLYEPPALAPPAAPAAPVPKPTAGAPPPHEAQPAAPTPAALAAPPAMLPAAAVVSLEKPADGPPLIGLASDTLEMAEKIDLAALLRPIIAAYSAAAAEPLAVKPTGRWAHPAERRPAEPRGAARDPGRFAPMVRGAALFRRNAVEPKDDELPTVAPSNGSASEEEEAVPPEDRDALARYIEDGDPPSPPRGIAGLSHRRPLRTLFIGGALVAVVLAAGATYVIIQSEEPVALPPTVAADLAKIVPASTPADTDDKMTEASASSGDDNNRISRVIEPAGPAVDPPAKAGDAPASADHAATDVAVGGDDSGQISPRTLSAGPPMPVTSKPTSDGGAAKPPPGASPAATPAVVGGAAAAADASALPAAPARVPIPRPKPTVIPDKAGEPLPTPPPVASSGGLY